VRPEGSLEIYKNFAQGLLNSGYQRLLNDCFTSAKSVSCYRCLT